MLPVTAPTNAIYTYCVWVKGIDIVQSLDDEEACGSYVVGDPIWMYHQIQAWPSD